MRIARNRTARPQPDTLVIVSSDHSHSFSYAGYARRNANVLGEQYICCSFGTSRLSVQWKNWTYVAQENKTIFSYYLSVRLLYAYYFMRL